MDGKNKKIGTESQRMAYSWKINNFVTVFTTFDNKFP
jgi:hypothetical protein